MQPVAAEIGKMADNLQVELNALEAQKNTIQAEIDKSRARYDQYEADIKVSEKKIADNKSALGDIDSWTCTSIPTPQHLRWSPAARRLWFCR